VERKSSVEPAVADIVQRLSSVVQAMRNHSQEMVSLANQLTHLHGETKCHCETKQIHPETTQLRMEIKMPSPVSKLDSPDCPSPPLKPSRVWMGPDEPAPEIPGLVTEKEVLFHEKDGLFRQEEVADQSSRFSLTSGNSYHKRHSASSLPLRRPAKRIFADTEVMTQTFVDNYEHSRQEVYRKDGFAQRCVRHVAFETAAFVLICINTVWMSVEIDLNPSPVLHRSPPVFQVVGHMFCALFLLEFVVRVMALKSKWLALKEPWLILDAVLVTLIVFETWILGLFMVSTGNTGGGNFEALVAFRALRLLRVLRLARLLRGLPELMVIVRAIGIALRAISVVLLLLALIVYVGSIVFRVLMEGTALGGLRFASVPEAMTTLLLEVTLSGTRGGPVVREAGSEHPIYGAALLLFALLANVTIMGVLGGLLVQTVKTVAEVEKEEHQIRRAAKALDEVWDDITYNETEKNVISEGQLRMYLSMGEGTKVLQEVGVDLEGLGFVSGFVFEQHGGYLTKPQLMHMVVDLRGNNTAKVKDHVGTRRFMDILFKQYGLRRYSHSVSKEAPPRDREAQCESPRAS